MNKTIKTEDDVKAFVEEFYSETKGSGDPFWDCATHEALTCLGNYAKENEGDMQLVKDMVSELLADEVHAFKQLQGTKGFANFAIAPETTRKYVYIHLQYLFA